MNKYEIIDEANYFEDSLYQLEVESKGWLSGISIKSEDHIYALNFYDTYRFKQDIDEELKENSFLNLNYYDSNIIFLKKVMPQLVLDAIEKLFNCPVQLACLNRVCQEGVTTNEN